jgi:hypothetical protein
MNIILDIAKIVISVATLIYLYKIYKKRKED